VAVGAGVGVAVGVGLEVEVGVGMIVCSGPMYFVETTQLSAIIVVAAQL
jgi:hypothetical protein